jgi:hypothetical protein
LKSGSKTSDDKKSLKSLKFLLFHFLVKLKFYVIHIDKYAYKTFIQKKFDAIIDCFNVFERISYLNLKRYFNNNFLMKD